MNVLHVLDPLPAEAWVQHVGWTLVQFLWQGTVISLIFAAARSGLRRGTTARARYALACAALSLMVMAPVWTFTARVTVPIAPAWAGLSTDTWRVALPWLVAAWLGGVVICSTRLIAGWRVSARLRSTGVRPAQPDWQRRLDDLIRRVGLSRPVRLLISSLVDIPVVVGWWRPVILVPAGALTGLPPAYIEALLAHELAHVRRLDYLVNILQSLAEAVLFYHPAVWWISDQIRIEREICCDDLAVAASGDALTYAHALAELESRRPAHQPALAATGGSLVDRIRRLIGQTPPASHALPSPAAAGTMSLLWAVGIGAVGAHAAPLAPMSSAIVASPAVERPSPASPGPILSTLLFGPVGPAPPVQPSHQQPRVAPVQSADTHSASIGGVITAADNGRPLSRAHVTITADGAAPARSTMTDEDGHYVFTDLPAGRYTISASKTGYFDATLGETSRSNAGTPVPLADGQKRDHVDLRLPKGGVISGVVLDEHGDPSPDTSVRAMRIDLQTGERALVTQASTQTDDRGVYRLHNLPDGTYLVVAAPTLDTDPYAGRGGGGRGGGGRADGRSPAPVPAASPSSAQDVRLDYVPVYFPGTASAASATSITIHLGEEKDGIDFPLQLVPIAKLEGTIVGLDAPAAVEFRLGPGASLPATFSGGPPPSVRLVSADDMPGQARLAGIVMIEGNHFTFSSVAPGHYVIEARGSRPNPAGGSPLGVWGDLPVVIDGRNLDDLVIPVQDGITISGHLTVDPAVAAGAPNLGLMRLTLTRHSGDQMGAAALIPRAVATSSGQFSIPGVTPGTYTLNVAGPRGWMAKSVLIGDRDALDFGLTVRGAEVPGDLAVVVTNLSTEISGVLQDAGGTPTSDGTVIVFAADSKYWLAGGRRIKATRPGTDGRFTIPGLPAGDYLIAVVTDVEPGQWFDPALLQELRSASTPIHLSDGDRKTQDLRIAGGRGR